MPSVSSSAAAVAASRRADYLQGLALAVVGAVCFSAKAVVAKLMYRHGVDAVSVIALRMLLSLPFFLLVAAWTWRSPPRLRAGDIVRIMLLGLCGYYASSMLDFLGLQYISAGLERLILFLTPTFVLLLGALALQRKVSLRQGVSLAMAYAGIVLVFWHDVHLDGSATLIGGALVLGSALTYAVYLLLSGELVERIGSLRLVALAMITSCALCLLQYALLRPPPSLLQQPAPVWGLSLVLATLCTVLPVFLTMIAVSRVGAGPASQAGMVGPVSTLFLAWWLLGEPITGLQMAGTALVLGGIFLLSGRSRPVEPAAAAE